MIRRLRRQNKSFLPYVCRDNDPEEEVDGNDFETVLDEGHGYHE